MGDDYESKPGETTAQMMQGMTQNLPSLMEIINAEITPNELAQLQASQAVSPGYSELQTQLYRDYAPELAEIGSDIRNQSMMDQASGELAVMQGPGRELVEEGLDIQRLADPEYFATREATGNAIIDMFDNAGLTGGEIEAINRSVNQQNIGRGLYDTPTMTNVVTNAQQYGNAANQKMQQAIAQATSFLPTSQSGLDPFMQATGRTGMAPMGEDRFMNARQSAGEQSTAVAQQFLGELGANARQSDQINSQRRTALDKWMNIGGNVLMSAGNSM